MSFIDILQVGELQVKETRIFEILSENNKAKTDGNGTDGGERRQVTYDICHISSELLEDGETKLEQ